MELGLSLGDANSRRSFNSIEDSSNQLGLGFNTTLSIGPVITKQRDQHQHPQQKHKHKYNNSDEYDITTEEATNESLISPSLKANNNKSLLLQLDLLPPTPHPLQNAGSFSRGLDVNMTETEEEMVLSSSPNSTASISFQMDLCMFRDDKRSCCSRASDEDENVGSTRKKLRLSKEQSAFLEESFKEHTTLNPKQKIALAKQLHLRPRQVEVWFQNRRARTKLKQIEVECEYLKRCCNTLREENRRLQREIQELRALKTSNPLHMQLPATTLSMCPSCERVTTADEPTNNSQAIVGFSRFYPHPHPTTPLHLELN